MGLISTITYTSELILCFIISANNLGKGISGVLPQSILAVWLANLALSIKVHTILRSSMYRAMSFSARTLKEKYFLWPLIILHVVSWSRSVLLSTTRTCHYSFPKHFSLFILSACWASLQKFLKKSLTRTSSSFQKCNTCTFKSESVFSDCQQILTKTPFVVFVRSIDYKN